LRTNPQKHQWYYYPNMRTDEVLVFKQVHFVKGQEVGRMPVFHTGFRPGEGAADAEARCSFEYRVGFTYE